MFQGMYIGKMFVNFTVMRENYIDCLISEDLDFFRPVDIWFDIDVNSKTMKFKNCHGNQYFPHCIVIILPKVSQFIKRSD